MTYEFGLTIGLFALFSGLIAVLLCMDARHKRQMSVELRKAQAEATAAIERERWIKLCEGQKAALAAKDAQIRSLEREKGVMEQLLVTNVKGCVRAKKGAGQWQNNGQEGANDEA